MNSKLYRKDAGEMGSASTSTPARRRIFPRSRHWLALSLFFVLKTSALEPWTVPGDANSIKNPLPRESTIITQGRKLYEDRCVDCHGKRGRGDGPGAADLERKPTDLTNPKILSQEDGALFWKITNGRKPMPGYGRKLSEEQRWEIIHYMRSLAAKDTKAR